MRVKTSEEGEIWIEHFIPKELREVTMISVEAPEGRTLHLRVDDPQELVDLLKEAIGNVPPADGEVWNIYGRSWAYSTSRGFIPLHKITDDAPVLGWSWNEVRDMRDAGLAESVGINVKDVW